MKIKCPIPYCNKVYDIELEKIKRGTYNHWMYGGNITVLQRHLRQKHKDELYFIVTSQLIKIHEKIEYWDDKKFSGNEHAIPIMSEMKSLLDNEK